MCYPCHRTSYICLISILHYSSVFDCKFIWKSYVNFSFIEFIFVMVKDTYLLTYLTLSKVIFLSMCGVSVFCSFTPLPSVFFVFHRKDIVFWIKSADIWLLRVINFQKQRYGGPLFVSANYSFSLLFHSVIIHVVWKT